MSDDTPTPRNRRERRAADKANKTTKTTSSTTSSSHLNTKLKEIPLTKPDFDAPRAPGAPKTLYEIAAERQKELEKEGFWDKSGDKYAHGEDEGDHQFWSGPEDEEPLSAWAESLLWGVNLSMLHFTLDVLVFHQYRQELPWAEIFTRTGKILPGLFFVIYVLHTKTVMKWEKMRQVFFFGTSVTAGCYLLRSGNRDGYFAVMKRAPPVGTLWVWSCVEMDLWWAVAHVVIVGVYMKWNGFSAF